MPVVPAGVDALQGHHREVREGEPGVFVFENRDFPLETECGAFNAGHGAACEAAAAVRMAREKSRDKDLEAALFERQSPIDDP